MKAIFTQTNKPIKKQTFKRKRKRVTKNRNRNEAITNNGSSDVNKITAIWFGIAFTICTVVFAAGKIVSELQTNAIGIQSNNVAIQENKKDITAIKIHKATLTIEFKNLSCDISEIKKDIKLLLLHKDIK